MLREAGGTKPASSDQFDFADSSLQTSILTYLIILVDLESVAMDFTLELM